MVVVRAALLIFGALEQGQHVVPSPARIAHLPPAVVILGLTAHIQQSVEGRRAAKYLAAWPVEPATVEAGIGLGSVAPVHGGMMHGLEGSALSRLAITQPADPAPMMT